MKMKTRQICFILFAYTALSRLLIYPTALSNFSDRDMLFPALIDFLISGIVVWAAAYLCSKTDKTFYEVLKSAFNIVIARIICGVFAAFFMLTALYLIFEQKLYVQSIFYDTVPSLIAFLPFFVFAVYAGSKGFENVGRCADICLPVFVLSFAAIMWMSAAEVDPGNLLPILKTPFKSIIGGAVGTFYRFVEPAWIIMFMGRFKYKKGDAAKITLSYALGALVVLALLFVYRGIYGDITTSRQFAISKIALFFSAVDTVGRIDLIILYILELPMLFALVLNIQLAVQCTCDCTGVYKRNVVSFVLNLILLILIVVFNHRFFAINEAYSRWNWIITLIFALIIPVLTAIPIRRARDEK